MRATKRPIGIVALMVVVVLVALPATVSADCNGPACGDVEQGLDAVGVVVLFALLVSFATLMALGGRLVRKDRRSTD